MLCDNEILSLMKLSLNLNELILLVTKHWHEFIFIVKKNLESI